MKRLFIAIKSPPAIQKAISEIMEEWQQHTDRNEIRWVDPSLFHLTLFYLGDTPDDKVPYIIESMQDATTGVRPFKLVLSRLATFPSSAAAKVAFIQLEEINSHSLNSMHRKLASAFHNLDVAIDDKRFIPHITMGRAKRALSLNTGWYVTRSLSWSVNQIDLMESRLGRLGPNYLTLQSIPLSLRTENSRI